MPQLKLSYPGAQLIYLPSQLFVPSSFVEFRERQKSFARVFVGNLKPFNFYFYPGNILNFAFRYIDLCFIFVCKGTSLKKKTKTSQMYAVSINAEGFFFLFTFAIVRDAARPHVS